MPPPSWPKSSPSDRASTKTRARQCPTCSSPRGACLGSRFRPATWRHADLLGASPRAHRGAPQGRTLAALARLSLVSRRAAGALAAASEAQRIAPDDWVRSLACAHRGPPIGNLARRLRRSRAYSRPRAVGDVAGDGVRALGGAARKTRRAPVSSRPRRSPLTLIPSVARAVEHAWGPVRRRGLAAHARELDICPVPRRRRRAAPCSAARAHARLCSCLTRDRRRVRCAPRCSGRSPRDGCL